MTMHTTKDICCDRFSRRAITNESLPTSWINTNGNLKGKKLSNKRQTIVLSDSLIKSLQPVDADYHFKKGNGVTSLSGLKIEKMRHQKNKNEKCSMYVVNIASKCSKTKGNSRELIEDIIKMAHNLKSSAKDALMSDSGVCLRDDIIGSNQILDHYQKGLFLSSGIISI